MLEIYRLCRLETIPGTLFYGVGMCVTWSPVWKWVLIIWFL